MHEGGVLIRYAHLGAIADGLEVGQWVESGHVIGFVGNSGTSEEWKGTDLELHLHTDILVYGENVWMDYSPADMRAMMAEIFATPP